MVMCMFNSTSESQDEDSMLMCLSKSPEVDSMSMCQSNSNCDAVVMGARAQIRHSPLKSASKCLIVESSSGSFVRPSKIFVWEP